MNILAAILIPSCVLALSLFSLGIWLHFRRRGGLKTLDSSPPSSVGRTRTLAQSSSLSTPAPSFATHPSTSSFGIHEIGIMSSREDVVAVRTGVGAGARAAFALTPTPPSSLRITVVGDGYNGDDEKDEEEDESDIEGLKLPPPAYFRAGVVV